MLKFIFLCSFSLQAFIINSQVENSLEKGIDFVWHSEYDSAKYVLGNIVKSDKSARSIEKGRAYMYLGRANQLQSNFDDAVKSFHKALSIFKAEKDRNYIAECNTWLAECYRVLGQFEISKKYLDEAGNIVNKRGVSDFTKALYYSRMAAFVQETDNDPKKTGVIMYSQMAKDLAIKIKNQNIEASAINELGFAYENMGDKRAISHYLMAYNLWVETGNAHYATQSLVNIVREYIKRLDYKKAMIYAEKGFKIAQEKKYGMLLQHFAAQIMQGEEKLGNHKKALKYAHLYHDQFERQIQKLWSLSILEIEQKYDLKHQKELTKIQKNKAIVANLKAIRNKNQLNYSIIISIILVAFLLTVLYFSNNLKQKNKQLQIALDQKKVLLMEVYHRVKNNLTFLSSLLFLRAKSIKEDPIKQMILECQARVHSMAIVHQQLYQLNEDSIIDFRVFCEKLFSEIDVFGRDEKSRILYKVKGNIRELNLNNSIFAGMIINELTLNSIKHAQSLNILEIGVELMYSDTSFDIKFFDNGVGLSEEESKFENGGFGFQMIRILTEQLRSTIVYYKENNLNYFHLKIPVN